MSKEVDLDALITDFAHNAARFMKEVGAERLADNETPLCVTVDEIAERCGFTVFDWQYIKPKMIELRYNVCYLPGKGHYLGKEGEWARNIVVGKAQVDGRINGIRKLMIIAGETHQLEDGKEWAQLTFGVNLGEVSTFLNRAGQGLPASLHTYLIESGTD